MFLNNWPLYFGYFKENSIREWSFKRAATIETYADYDPIPVPLNIIYRFGKLFWYAAGMTEDKDNEMDKEVVSPKILNYLM